MGNSTGKCRTCSEGKCERKYKNRKRCDDPNNCTCTCQEEAIETFAKGFSSIGYGMCAVTVSVVFTLATAGAGLGAVATIAALSGCSALTGVGSAMIIHPVAKKMSGERITGGNYVKDVAIGGTIGAVTGPIGLGGASATASIASKVGTEVGKQGAVKFGCRTAVGAVSGATASAIQEVAEATSRKVSGEKAFANVKSSLINIGKGAALGAATGGAAHLSGNVVNKVVETGVGRSATKVAADTVSTFIIDTSSQMIENDGKVDGEKLLFNLVSRATTSAGSEAISSLCYNDLNNKKLPKTSKQMDKATHGPQGPTGNERPTGTFSQ